LVVIWLVLQHVTLQLKRITKLVSVVVVWCGRVVLLLHVICIFYCRNRNRNRNYHRPVAVCFYGSCSISSGSAHSPAILDSNPQTRLNCLFKYELDPSPIAPLLILSEEPWEVQVNVMKLGQMCSPYAHHTVFSASTSVYCSQCYCEGRR
jgi:hypothetical protein